MNDPFATTLVVGIGGVATKEIIGKIWDSGKEWLSARYANHQLEVQEKAAENTEDFLKELAFRVDEAEKKGSQTKDVVDAAFKEPSFSVLLQQAILNSSQTADNGKHQLLAKLVAEKLQAKEESTQSLASKMACEAITYATGKQMKLLGLKFFLSYRLPGFNEQAAPLITREIFEATCALYIERSCAPMLVEDFNPLDLLHLEALSCVRLLSAYNGDLQMSSWKMGNFIYTNEHFLSTANGQKIKSLWDKGLVSVALTSVGLLVATYVCDTLTQTNTHLGPDWTGTA